MEQVDSIADLAAVEVAYCDARQALREAYRLGLSKSAEVRSASPALVLASDLNVSAIDAHLTPEKVSAFYRDVLAWTTEIVRDAAELPRLAGLSLVIARALYRNQTVIFQAMALREEDYRCRCAVITVNFADPMAKARLTAPWGLLLASNPRMLPIGIPGDKVDIARDLSPPQASFMTRLRFTNWRSKAYRMMLGIWRYLPFDSPKGTVLIVSEGETLKETAIELAGRGYGLMKLPGTLADGGRSVSPELDLDALKPLLQARLLKWLVPQAAAVVEGMLLQRISDDIVTYQSSLAAWRIQLGELQKARPRVILSNHVSSPNAMALAQAARERRLPFAVFQHGVTREIAAFGDRAEAFYETTNADVFFTYNAEAARVTNTSTLKLGNAVCVGMPSSHYRNRGATSEDLGAPPIWYISTMLYIGNMQTLERAMADCDHANYEIEIIDNVLSRLPHGVFYKPYPASRYADPDPVSLRAGQAANVELYHGGDDLRYLMAKSRVLVTSRPGSTTGWCMTSGKPLVYILFPGRPLTEAAREAFDASVFLFDGAAPDIHDQLRDFLSQPLEEIERKWREKATARRETMHRFIDGGERKAGAAAADYLVDAGFDPAKMKLVDARAAV